MAKNIDFMGATFPDVPSIRLPQHEGGLVSFDDTTDATATADKILQGYTAYANGQKLTGTASGGITPSGTISITQNGQVDVTQYAIADVNVSGGGGASWELLASEVYRVDVQTVETDLGTITLDFDDVYTDKKLIYGIARKRNYAQSAKEHIGTDTFFANPNPKNGDLTTDLTPSPNRGMRNYFINSSNKYAVSISATTSGGGVYIKQIRNDGTVCHLDIASRQVSAWGNLYGTYDFYVYALSWPTGLDPYK